MDDDPDMRESLSTLLTALGHPVCAYASAAEFRAGLPGISGGVLIVDLAMPEESGIELCQSLYEQGIRLPVIFITAHADVTSAVAAMKTGALEFLEKPFDRATLVRQVDKALELDRQWREREVAFRRLDERLAALNTTDRETLALILQGESNKRMALRLNVTERAVERRRQKLMQRLETHSLAELMDLAITHRVLDEMRRLRNLNR
ncbi:MAG: response regulator transcription factor [Planctomycetaceae bacterium]